VKEVRTIEKVICYHCHDVCKDEHIVFDNKDFCCNGCKTVYEILRDNDLCTYYDLDQNPGISLKSKDFNDKYAYLDNEEIARMLINFSDKEKSRIVFFIPAIHCSSCIWLLENLYKLHEAVEHSRVNFVRKEMTIEFLHDKMSLRELVELLATIGYEPYISLDNEGKKKQKSINRSLYIKIGVAGFAFGNIMLLSFPEYFGFSGISDRLVQKFITYLNLFLSLPVVFYCASDYYRSAIQGLKQKFVSIDIPIALGITALFSRSLYEIFTSSGPGYLDSLAGLVFFLLVGKWFQNFTYEGLSFERDYKSYFPLAILRKDAGEWKNVPVKNLAKGDLISVRNQEVIPADGVLVSESAAIDYSFVTGESEPVNKKKGEYIYAGGRQTGSKIEIEVIKPVSRSYLTQLWNNEIFQKADDSNLQGVVNKVSKYFTLAVLGIAIAALVFWLTIDFSKALYVFSAVLIVACPCALALSTPFTLGNVMRIFGKLGFYLKNAHVIERMTEIDHVVFDKTGTLTIGKAATVVFDGEELSENEKSGVASVVANSTHPLSEKIYQYLKGSDFAGKAKDFNEIAGQGITAEARGQLIKLGSKSFVLNGESHLFTNLDDELTTVYLQVDNKFKGRFIIKSHYREGLERVLSSLSGTLGMSLITGDSETGADQLKKFFPTGSTFSFRQEPVQKLEYVKKLQLSNKKVMMIGDGLNDSGALKQSNVGISVSEKSTNFTPASDAILASGSFQKFHQLFNFCFTAKKIIIFSFVISFLYNVVGLSFAVTGNLSPLFAAILMPLSSISVVAFATISVNLMSRVKNIL